MGHTFVYGEEGRTIVKIRKEVLGRLRKLPSKVSASPKPARTLGILNMKYSDQVGLSLNYTRFHPILQFVVLVVVRFVFAVFVVVVFDR